MNPSHESDAAGAADRLPEKIAGMEEEIERLRGDLAEASVLAEKLYAIFERCPDAIFVKDLEGRYDLANPATVHLLGVDADTVIGNTDDDFFSKEMAEEVRDVDQFVVASSQPLRYEIRRVWQGREKVIQTTKWPWLLEGRPAGVIGISRDISQVAFDRELRELHSSVARVLLFSGPRSSAIAALPGIFLNALDADLVIRWVVSGDRFECREVAAEAKRARPFIEECETMSLGIDEGFPGEILRAAEPVLRPLSEVPEESKRLEYARELEIRSMFGFAVRGRDGDEVFEIATSDERTAREDLFDALMQVRSLIEDYLQSAD